MNRRSTLTIALVAFMCVLLTGGPFTLAAFAKITVKATDEDVKLVTIVKGDTLWDLAQKYLKEADKWPWFEQYNEYTNPHLIYPGEKMQIPLKWLEGMLDAEERGVGATSVELQEMQAMYQESLKQLEAATAELTDTRELLNNLKSQNAALEQALQDRDDQMAALRRMFENARGDLGSELQDLRDMLDDVSKSTELRRQLREANEQLTIKIESLQVALDARAEEIQANAAKVSSLEEQIAKVHTELARTQEMILALQTRISEVEGYVEAPNKSKKTFAFLAAVAGGIAWVAVNALSHAD